MANAVGAMALPQKGVKQRLQDPYKMCRLCFQSPGTHDVLKLPLCLQAIKKLYDIEIQPTDRYTKLVCEKCIGSVQEFCMHQTLVKAGQEIFSKRIEMLEQLMMSHMKVEPCNTDREGPPGDVDSQPLAMIDKNDESDLDMDDVITEAPTSPQNQSPSITPPPQKDQPQQQQRAAEDVVVSNESAHEIGKDKEQIQSLKIKRTSDSSSYRIVANDKDKHGTQTRPKTPMNSKADRTATPNESNARSSTKRPHSKELDALNDDQAKQAGRISKRRATTANHCLESDVSNGPSGRKRRLSSSKKNADHTEEAGTTHRTRNASGSGGNDTTTTSKRMRLEQNAKKSDGAADSRTPKKHDTTKSTQANSDSLSSNIVPASAVDTTVSATITISTPRSNKSQKRVSKATTPRITEYFAQQKTSTPVQAPSTVSTPAPTAVAAPAPASLMCDQCSTILSSVNELNFHKKSHELNCCVKCKKAIDNAENPISAHVVSCFLLDNKISNDLLTRFLKVKVDLDRLTPVKIKQIQKDLQSDESKNVTNGGAAQSSAEQSTDKPRRESSPSAADSAQNSTNDGKNDSDRHGAKKSKNKKCNSSKSSTPKNAHDFSDDVLINENTSAPLNWNDDPNKDNKIFSLRNFECDPNIYINIKEVLNNGSAETQHKVTNLVKRIGSLKQKRSAPQRAPSPHVPAEAPAHNASPVLAAALANSAAKPSPTSAVNGRNLQHPQQPLSVRKLSTMQTPAQVQSLQNALAQQNRPIAPVQNALNGGPYTAVVSHALHASNMPQSPQVACAPQATPLANMQPIAYAPNASNAPNAPTLLDLPQRVRLRNRAYSIHFAPNEQVPGLITARRQSYGHGLLTPLPTMQAAVACTALTGATAASSTDTPQQPEHNHTRFPMSNSPNFFSQNGQRPTPPPQFITQIHAREIAVKNTATPNPSPSPNPPKQLKVLSVDDLNSRAANAAQPIQSVANSRTDSPNSTENNSNLNNNQIAAVKRVRTKTTPMRNSGVFISDDANVTISVSLTKLGADQAELSLTTEQHGKISYDALTDKRKQEVQSSLLKDDVWLKMLKHLKIIRPTNETLQLFKQILPVQQHNTFMKELRNVYGSRI